MAVNWVTQNIKRMVQKRALERWETTLAKCEVPSEAIWPTVKFLTYRGGPNAPSAIHGSLGPVSYPVDKASITADCLENQFTVHALCEALLATNDEDTINF
jgi:hypothetical protein